MLTDGRRRASERGSVPMAMLVLGIITVLGVGLLVRSQSDLRASAAAGASERAVLGTDRGVAEALAMIDAGARGDFDGSGALLDGTYRFDAVQVAVDQFRIRSTATINGRDETIEALIGGEPVPPDVLFAYGGASLRGPSVRVSGTTGTNGALDVGDGAGLERVELLGPGASCAGCTSAVVQADARDLPTMPSAGGSPRPCPAGGVVTGVVDGQSGTPISCGEATIELQGVITVVNGPLVIHVADGSDLVIDGATVNTAGDVADLVVVVEGPNGTVDLVDSSLRAGVLAPERSVAASEVRLEGQLIVGDLVVSSGSTFTVDPDADGPPPNYAGWQVISWLEIDP